MGEGPWEIWINPHDPKQVETAKLFGQAYPQGKVDCFGWLTGGPRLFNSRPHAVASGPENVREHLEAKLEEAQMAFAEPLVAAS